ncbi:hypothetical protein LTR37_006527 [Vermiconidia calcicola]|uniref:Uncharacterized protein n=1 Tax=Vermiconidia calcicola TaxID=1690605 RepID=A0ACC3NGF9_9PEZI|nr:hypothetical protein LTR37_006527 [Vermiconidia calcicola]
MATPSNPFTTLPLETNQHIASLIEYDTDLCSFRLICHATNDAVEADSCSFWRRRFLGHFERPVGEPSLWKGAEGNLRFKKEYAKRRGCLKNGARFGSGETRRERECLEVVRALVVDSFSEHNPAHAGDKIYSSTNMTHLLKFLRANNILNIFEPPKVKPSRFTTSTRRTDCSSSSTQQQPSLLLRALQVLGAPMLLSFEPHLRNRHYAYPDSQALVYSTATTHPIFHGCYGLDVNMEYVLHNLNFWKYHMLREVEGTLFYAFQDLEGHERPRWWEGKLGQAGALGRKWKGSYAYVNREEIVAVRAGRGEDEQIQDEFAGEDQAFTFQDMQLQLVDESTTAFPWPETFERHLLSLNGAKGRGAFTRAQTRTTPANEIAHLKHRSFRFEGAGQDVTEQFLASGWLNALPKQSGIPGWQRMTMMKYFEDEVTGNVDEGALWAYEGVVVPGGNVVVGRWWCPNEGVDGGEVYSGPFLLWCVDGPGDGDGDGEVSGTGDGGA